jgi:response regulator RpfG family c-di-GMP phosphodiesterase
LEAALSASKADVARKRALLEKRKKEADVAPSTQKDVEEERRRAEEFKQQARTKEETISELRKQLTALREESQMTKQELYDFLFHRRLRCEVLTKRKLIYSFS